MKASTRQDLRSAAAAAFVLYCGLVLGWMFHQVIRALAH